MVWFGKTAFASPDNDWRCSNGATSNDVALLIEARNDQVVFGDASGYDKDMDWDIKGLGLGDSGSIALISYCERVHHRNGLGRIGALLVW